ncbi:PACE efflux transporter [Psychromonas hadalis]|uniref:PACE efflux transporter n=1 Tax=Psychromonas hadalis TaxID=211669 RepID=UPI0003B737A5|nr:PACE efflux transporter [Psychromonas hadalis]
MDIKERILHSLIFEAIALGIMISVAISFTENGLKTMTGLALVLSLIAMCWNYIYNLFFDRVFGTNRIKRSFKMRLGHGLGFELGMIITTLPLIMWVMQVDLWTAFILDLGVVVFFLVYAIIYNWSYDVIRDRVVSMSS